MYIYTYIYIYIYTYIYVCMCVYVASPCRSQRWSTLRSFTACARPPRVNPHNKNNIKRGSPERILRPWS